MALVEQLGDDSWQVVCAACCHMALVFAIMHIYNFYFMYTSCWVVVLWCVCVCPSIGGVGGKVVCFCPFLFFFFFFIFLFKLVFVA